MIVQTILATPRSRPRGQIFSPLRELTIATSQIISFGAIKETGIESFLQTEKWSVFFFGRPQ